MAGFVRSSRDFLRNTALALTTLALACGSSSNKAEPIEATHAAGASGFAAGGSEAAAGGSAAAGPARGGSAAAQGGSGTPGTAGDRGTAGQTATDGSLPPCNPEDNTLTISTGDLLTDLPGQMTFTVFDLPTSKDFTGNGENGDVRVHLPEPAKMDRVFPTATVVDPLDDQSVNIELVLASGVLNARYVVQTGARVYAQVTASRVALTFCDVQFYPGSDPPDLPVITVSGRVVAITR